MKNSFLFMILLIGFMPVFAQENSAQILAYQTEAGIVLLDVERNITSEPLPNSVNHSGLYWSGNGRFLSYVERIPEAEYGTGRLWAYDVETGVLTLVDIQIQNELYFSGHFWSADGVTFYYYAKKSLLSTSWAEFNPQSFLSNDYFSSDYFRIYYHDYSPGGAYLVISTDQGNFLLETNTGNLLPLHSNIINFTWLRDGYFIYFTDTNPSMTVYSLNLSDGTEDLLFELEMSGVQQVDYIRWVDGLLEFTPRDKGGFVWDGESVTEFDLSNAPLSFGNYSPDGRYAVTQGSEPGTFTLWTRASNEVQQIHWVEDDSSGIGSMIWSPDSTKFIYNTGRYAGLYEVASGNQQAFNAPRCSEGRCAGGHWFDHKCGDWSPDARWIVCDLRFADTYGVAETFVIDTVNGGVTLLPDAIERDANYTMAWRPR